MPHSLVNELSDTAFPKHVSVSLVLALKRTFRTACSSVPLVPVLEFQNWTKPAIARSDTLMPVVSPTRKKQTQLRIAKAPNTVPYREFLALATRWTLPAGDR